MKKPVEQHVGFPGFHPPLPPPPNCKSDTDIEYTFYVDDAMMPFKNMLVSHLIVVPHDGLVLATFAECIGMKSTRLINTYYQLSKTKRSLAIRDGAVQVSEKELLTLYRNNK